VWSVGPRRTTATAPSCWPGSRPGSKPASTAAVPWSGWATRPASRRPSRRWGQGQGRFAWSWGTSEWDRRPRIRRWRSGTWPG